MGPEFGTDAGKPAVVFRDLYGIKRSGTSFRNHLADFMKHMDFMPCPEVP